MLILLGGFLGSGRKMLARRLSEAHDLHHYDIQQFKIKEHFLDRTGVLHERVMKQPTDAARMRVYRKTAEHFPRLSKLHANVLIERTFHRSAPREFLLKEAKKHFNPVLFVWIDADEAVAQARIERMHEKGLIADLEAARAERAQSQQEFEPFITTPLPFTHHGSSEESVPRLWALIQTHRGIK